MTTVIVGGAIANKCGNSGEAWVRMSWAIGLQRLGFEVIMVEEISPEQCRDPSGRHTTLDESVNLAFFRLVTNEFGLNGSAALVCGNTSAGLNQDRLMERIDEADLLVNISGNLRSPWLLRPVRLRVFVDIDPGFTQLWLAQGQADTGLEGHHLFFTIGENIGTPSCPIPSGGICWRPTRQPVVLSQWPVCKKPPERGFTTVGTWRGPYGRPSFDGRLYGLKVHQFRHFIDLPTRSGHSFEAALAFDPEDGGDLAALRDAGWTVVDPGSVTATPAAFRRYVQSSAAEFSAAQGVYVETSCGWFSDRTVRYLASGRPAVVQETGFSARLPVGSGLLPFTTVEEACRAVAEVQQNYDHHSAAARLLAEEEFDSDKVLGRFVEDIGVAP